MATGPSRCSGATTSRRPRTARGVEASAEVRRVAGHRVERRGDSNREHGHNTDTGGYGVRLSHGVTVSKLLSEGGSTPPASTIRGGIRKRVPPRPLLRGSPRMARHRPGAHLDIDPNKLSYDHSWRSAHPSDLGRGHGSCSPSSCWGRAMRANSHVFSTPHYPPCKRALRASNARTHRWQARRAHPAPPDQPAILRG